MIKKSIIMLILLISASSLSAQTFEVFERAYNNLFSVSTENEKKMFIVRKIEILNDNNATSSVSDTSKFYVNSEFSFFKTKDQEIYKDSNKIVIIDFKTKNIIIHANNQLTSKYYFLYDICKISDLQYDDSSEKYLIFRQEIYSPEKIPAKRLYSYFYVNKSSQPTLEKISYDYASFSSDFKNASIEFVPTQKNVLPVDFTNIQKYLFKAIDVLQDKYTGFHLRDLRNRGKNVY